MKRIKTYKVYRHPVQGYQAVKDGFSWPGFLFTGVWLLYKRLWWHAAAFFLLAVLLVLIESGFDKEENTAGIFLTLWVQIGIYIFVGFKGNEWQATNLLNRGYQLMDTVQAESPDAAIAKIMKA